MTSIARTQLKTDILIYLDDNLRIFLWSTLGIAQPFLDHPGHYPQTEDAGYRRVLAACHELESEGILGSAIGTMNERTWYLKRRVDRECHDDIPF